MKKLLVFALISVLSTVSLGFRTISAQDIHYIKKTGSNSSDVLYSVSKSGDKTKLFIEIEGQKSCHEIDSDNRTVSWHIVDAGKQIDVLIILEGKRYHVKGRSKGQVVDKYEMSYGLPWYQNLAFICGKVVPDGRTVQYECFRPGEFSLHRMEASVVEDDGDRSCVRVHPSGKFAKLWHADYYFSNSTRGLVGYRAVEGLPGTPVTTWTLK